MITLQNFYQIFVGIGVISAILLVWVWQVYNSLVIKRNQLRTDLSDINIQVKQKIDLADRLIGLVKDYSKHEKETFENVTEARSALEKSKGVKDTSKVDNMLADTLRSIMMVVESYPNLEASKNFQDLSVDLKEIEGRIAHYREQYNESVQVYNNTIQTFPNLLVASTLGFKDEEFYHMS
jgi:LemA protein